MFKLYMLYSHLLATCTALGVIVTLNLQLLGKLGQVGDSTVRTIDLLMTGSMMVLYLTGAALVWLGLQERGDDMLDTTLIGKLLLVGLMTANMVVLRRRVLVHLRQPASLLSWTAAQRLTLALPVALASGLWITCAFLGYAMPLGYVMSVGAAFALVTLLFAAMSAGLVWRLEAHSQPRLAARARMAPRLRDYDEHEYLAM